MTSAHITPLDAASPGPRPLVGRSLRRMATGGGGGDD